MNIKGIEIIKHNIKHKVKHSQTLLDVFLFFL